MLVPSIIFFIILFVIACVVAPDFEIFKQVLCTSLFYAFVACFVSFILLDYITNLEIQFGVRLLAILLACVELLIFSIQFRGENAIGCYDIGESFGGIIASFCAIYILLLPIIPI